jgi:hypothetical protein
LAHVVNAGLVVATLSEEGERGVYKPIACRRSPARAAPLRRRAELAHTSAIPALRDGEIASVARNQRLFREFIASRTANSGELASLPAELAVDTAVMADTEELACCVPGRTVKHVGALSSLSRQAVLPLAIVLFFS